MSLGVVLPMMERPSDGAAARWPEIAAMASLAEEMGADTVWLGDEILWRDPQWPGPVGWWDCLTMAGAVAAATSSARVGTWVMSAVQHQPGMVVRAAETLDEISGGRFVLGLGAGHGGGATAFGFPTDKTVSRYLEALEIIVPLLRGEKAVSFEGEIHHATDAVVRPRGPRPGRVPLMMGGHAPRTMTAAARHADTWSAYPTTSSLPKAFRAMTNQLDRICDGIGRDPASIGRSVGVIVEPGSERSAEETGFGVPITGSVEQITDTIAGFADVGVTRVEVHPWPQTIDVLKQLAPVFATLTDCRS
jgi:alkanesulfonate monooxygenase SsuD/methylene tetrahydromethanopterin reductase-like flavin-dependent oxidoreductase (luciferase family)